MALVTYSAPAWSQGSGRLIAVVNDQAITQYDVDQRVNMNTTLNNTRGTKQQLRKAALSELINNILKRQEAKRLNLAVTPEQVNESYEGMAKRAGVTQEAWKTRLRKGGVSVKTIKQEVDASLSWRRVVQLRFGRRIQVENSDVDREYQRVLQNPRQSQKFYVLRRIVLPVKWNQPQIMINSRVSDGRKIVSAVKGCGRIRNATKGVFDVKILGVQNVPKEALPKELRRALDQVGPGRAVGPAKGPEGFIIFVYCNQKTIEAPEITREQVETQLRYRKFDRIGAQFLADLKRDAIIEYKTDDLRASVNTQ